MILIESLLWPQVPLLHAIQFCFAPIVEILPADLSFACYSTKAPNESRHLHLPRHHLGLPFLGPAQNLHPQ